MTNEREQDLVGGRGAERESAAKGGKAQPARSRRYGTGYPRTTETVLTSLQRGAGNALVSRLVSSTRLSAPFLQRDEQARMRAAFSGFWHNPDVELSAAEKELVHTAINQLLAQNIEIRTRLWRHYATHLLGKARPGERIDAIWKFQGGNEGETMSGKTYLHTHMFGTQRHNLGPVVLHEFVHAGTGSASGSFDQVQESRAYAIEYYFARRAGKRWRSQVAYRRGYIAGPPGSALGLAFKQTYNVVNYLDRVAQGRLSTDAFFGAVDQNISRQEARTELAGYVADVDHPDVLIQAIMARPVGREDPPTP